MGRTKKIPPRLVPQLHQMLQEGNTIEHISATLGQDFDAVMRALRATREQHAGTQALTWYLQHVTGSTTHQETITGGGGAQHAGSQQP